MGKVVRRGGTALLLVLMAIGLAACGGPTIKPGWAAFSVGTAADGTAVIYAGLEGKVIAIKADDGTAVKGWVDGFPSNDDPQNPGTLGDFYAAPVETADAVIVAASAVKGDNAQTEQVFVLEKKGFNVETKASVVRSVFSANGLIVGAPTVYGDSVYITSADGKVYLGDLKSGAKPAVLFSKSTFDIFGQETPVPIWGSVVREGDRLYLGSMGHKVYALGLDGEELWSFETQGAVAGTPAVGDGRVYVGDLTGRVYAIDATSGELAKGWTVFQAPGWVWGQPVLANGVLYVPSLDGKVYALDAKTGQENKDWCISTGGAVRATPALAGNVLYVASEDNKLYAQDLDTHKQKWAGPFLTDGALLTSPVVVGDTVYVATSSGKVYAVNAATGSGRVLYPQPK